jgi:hypothetical protein
MPSAHRGGPRFSLLTLLAIGSVLALAVGWAASAGRWAGERATLLALIPNGGDGPNQHVLETRQITIAMCSDGGHSPNAWELSLNSNGEAVLLSNPFAEPPISHAFQFSNEQLQAIRNLLISEQFFDLKDRYGDLVPDGSSETLTIVVGQHSKSVTFDFLRWDPSDPNYDAAQLRETARGLRVWLALRDGFPAVTMADERPFLRRALQAAEKLEAAAARK